jgi:hypothetical protein
MMKWVSEGVGNIKPMKGEGRRSFVALVEVERDDSDDEGGGWVVFDAFALDKVQEQSGRLVDDGDALAAFRAPLKATLQRFPALEVVTGGWVLIVVSAQAHGDALIAEVVLFGDSREGEQAPPQVSITLLESLASEDTVGLTRNSMLMGARRSPSNLISAMLNVPLDFDGPGEGCTYVAVYDVGQGNCNAIINDDEVPLIFFDFGWAPNFHAKSRPPQIPNFAFRDEAVTAPVVLSHWDMDHWCYAIKASAFNPASLTTKHEWKPEALRRFWIARAPQILEHQLGPLSQNFFAALQANKLLPSLSSILLWPDGVERIPFDAGWLEACSTPNPRRSDRNNSGIAMFVHPRWADAAILLTGDADFPSIPTVRRRGSLRLAGMVAPHHGATISTYAIPLPMPGTPSRLVMSVGSENSYGHPKREAIDAYIDRGWILSSTQERVDCYWKGVHHGAHVHGNTVLKFDNLDSDPGWCGWCGAEGNLCTRCSDLPFAVPVPGKKRPRKKRVKTVPLVNDM